MHYCILYNVKGEPEGYQIKLTNVSTEFVKQIEKANTEEAVAVVLELVMYLNVMTFLSHDMTLLTCDMTLYSDHSGCKISERAVKL